MQASVLRALEFDRIVEMVRQFALTPMGDERLAVLTPAVEIEQVARQLAATTETAVFLAEQGPLSLRASSDLTEIITALAVEGRALEPARLFSLARFLESAEETRSAIKRVSAAFPLLDHASAGTATFKGEIDQTRAAIDTSGEVVDSASPRLMSVRERLRKQKARLRSTLESYLRGKDTAKYLQEQVVTERNGRYVIVVRAEHRTSIPGIVHGASTSGASLYLEPLSTVDINNDIVALEEQEREEVHRILLALTDLFRVRPMDLQRTLHAATEVDVLQARARYSLTIDGIEPHLAKDGTLDLRAARHPLLKAAVPVTIQVLPPARVLLITGPNTGGKTVGLKTAGLLALMAQAGLRIPAADGSSLPVFRSVFADIGDEQSIDASLSTFSAHVANIVAMDRSLVTPALVLLDEVGSGTDPVEGGALGVAVVDYFRKRGAMVVATSHYDALKTYASTTDGVASAAFGFDADTFAPTYQLVYGSPGRSLALEIAARLGLNSGVIAEARKNLSERDAALADHLAKMDLEMRAVELERRSFTSRRAALETAEAQLEARERALHERESAARRRLSDEVNAQVRRARNEIDAVIVNLKAKTDDIAKQAAGRLVSTGATGSVRAEARAAVESVARQIVDQGTETEAAQSSPVVRARLASVGDRVIVGGLGVEAVVTGVHDGSADLDVRGKRLKANVRDLQVVGEAAPAPRVRVQVELQPRGALPSDLNVVGCTVDEAIARAERFLDETLLGDHRVIRVIHGYGTGQLKRALAGFLHEHPLVARFAPAPPEQGGGGVTVVELKD